MIDVVIKRIIRQLTLPISLSKGMNMDRSFVIKALARISSYVKMVFETVT